MHTHIHIHSIYTHKPTYIHIRIFTHTHIYIHTHSHTRIYTHTHTRARARTKQQNYSSLSLTVTFNSHHINTPSVLQFDVAAFNHLRGQSIFCQTVITDTRRFSQSQITTEYYKLAYRFLYRKKLTTG
jgi:hypothetical protein